MPVQRLLVIADNTPARAAQAQLAPLQSNLDQSRFALTAIPPGNSSPPIGIGGVATTREGISPSPESRIPTPEFLSLAHSPQPPAPVPRSNRWPLDPRAIWQLRQSILENQPDVVLTFGETAAIEGR